MATSDRDDGSARTSIHESLHEAGPYLTLGLELGLTMVIWMVAGYLLDQWLETLPWLTMTGVLIGIVSVAIQLTRAVKRSNESSRSSREKRRAKNEEGGEKSEERGERMMGADDRE